MFWKRKKEPTPGEQIVGLLKLLIVLGGIGFLVQIFGDAMSIDSGSGSGSSTAEQIRRAREAIRE